MLRHLAFAAVLICSVCPAAQPTSQPLEPPPTKRPARAGPPPGAPTAALLNRLRRGVNLSHWWWKPPAVEEGRIERLITDADITLIAAAGITHVRIPIDPALMTDSKERLNQHRTWELTGAVNRFHRAGIATVIDVHTSGSASIAMQIDKNPEGWERELLDFWTLFAPVWRNSPPEFLAVELFNEPNGLKEPDEWARAQDRLRAVVRKALPRHTIVLTGDDWGGIDSLVKLEPAADANVVYSFHFYDPHTFTHQQATWGAPMWKEIKGLRYPFDQANADTVLAGATDPKAINSVKWYAKEKWDAKAIQTRFDKAKAWAAEHQVSLYLGEFGAYRKGCDEPSRAAWLKDVRTAAEKCGIGWCAWDYSGGFGLTAGAPAKNGRTLDEPTARALGLTIPTPKR